MCEGNEERGTGGNDIIKGLAKSLARYVGASFAPSTDEKRERTQQNFSGVINTLFLAQRAVPANEEGGGGEEALTSE